MKQIYLNTFLSIVHNGGNISELRELGLTYTQISEISEHALGIGLIRYKEDGTIELSEQGIGYSYTAKSRESLKGPSYWLKPQDEWRRDRIAIDAPYIPKEKKPFKG